MRRALLALAALPCAGCFTVSTSEVHVRDDRAVVLEAPRGTPAIAEGGPQDAVVQRGRYWDMLDRVPYEVRATRGASGSLSLVCEACVASSLNASGTFDAELLHADGTTTPALSSSVDIGRELVIADYDVCMVHGHRSCQVSVPARLLVPTRDVLEVRRRVEPVRLWGVVALSVAAVWLGATAAVAFSSNSPAGHTFGERAPWVAAAAVPGLAIGLVGLWEVTTPTRVQVWRPGE